MLMYDDAIKGRANKVKQMFVQIWLGWLFNQSPCVTYIPPYDAYMFHCNAKMEEANITPQHGLKKRNGPRIEQQLK